MVIIVLLTIIGLYVFVWAVNEYIEEFEEGDKDEKGDE